MTLELGIFLLGMAVLAVGIVMAMRVPKSLKAGQGARQDSDPEQFFEGKVYGLAINAEPIPLPPIDRTGWGPGPWDDEADQYAWVSQGLTCRILRAVSSGSLCGYIEVGPLHPWYGKDYDAIKADCHGGLSYAARPVEQADGVQIWRLGFDCAHAFDLAPRTNAVMRLVMQPQLHKAMRPHESYRTVDYVKAEVEGLVAQAIATADAVVFDESLDLGDELDLLEDVVK